MGGSQLITVRTAYYSDLLLIGRVFGSKFDKFTLFSGLALPLWCINHNVYIRIGRNLVNDDPSLQRLWVVLTHNRLVDSVGTSGVRSAFTPRARAMGARPETNGEPCCLSGGSQLSCQVCARVGTSFRPPGGAGRDQNRARQFE